MSSNKILVLYVFHEFNKRVELFLNKCIFKDENVDFVVISNGNTKIIVPEYVKFVSRENIGYDFGGWSDALLTNELYKNYDYFIFVNSSVIGPFIPSYCKMKWTDVFINGLKDNVKLFGSTINTIRDPTNKSHVQSYVFSMDRTTLEYLIKCEIFSTTKYAKSFQECIDFNEIGMSKKVIENGWNIGSLLTYYNGIDFTFKTKTPEECKIVFLDDVMYPPYVGVLWDKYELIFIKGNRFGIS